MSVLMIVYRSMRMSVFMRMNVLMLVIVRMRMFVLMIWLMLMAVRLFVLMILHGMSVFVMLDFIRDDVNLGPAKSPAGHLPALKTRADVQPRCSALQQGEGNARIHKRAQKHIAADAREAFEIRNSHQGNCKRLSVVRGESPVIRRRGGSRLRREGQR